MERIENMDELQWRAIPVDNLDGLKAKLDKLGKKADKLGVSRPILIEGNEFSIIDPSYDTTGLSAAELKFAPRIPMIYVLVLGPVIKLKGWQFHAQIEHTEHGNIINSKDATETQLHQYRNCPPNCDHCKVDRRRKFTYIVKREV